MSKFYRFFAPEPTDLLEVQRML